MIHKDFLAEKLKLFAEACTRPLVEAHLHGDLSNIGEVEAAIGELLEMNPDVCMQLAPASLTTMMSLQGIGNAVSQEVAYVLRKLCLFSVVYEGFLEYYKKSKSRGCIRRLGSVCIAYV